MPRLPMFAFVAALSAPAVAQVATPAQPGATPAPATAAQATAATPTVGATIYDSAGTVVGTVEQITPQAVVVNLGTTKVGLPPASIGSGPRGLQVSITRAEVEAAAKQAQAGAQQQMAAQLTTGTTVRGAAGATLGTIKTADADFVTLTTPRGDVKLPVTGFGPGPNGPVLGMTAAQLDEAITAAGGAAAPAGDTATEATTPGTAATTTTTKTSTKTTTRKPR